MNSTTRQLDFDLVAPKRLREDERQKQSSTAQSEVATIHNHGFYCGRGGRNSDAILLLDPTAGNESVNTHCCRATTELQKRELIADVNAESETGTVTDKEALVSDDAYQHMQSWSKPNPPSTSLLLELLLTAILGTYDPQTLEFRTYRLRPLHDLRTRCHTTILRVR